MTGTGVQALRIYTVRRIARAAFVGAYPSKSIVRVPAAMLYSPEDVKDLSIANNAVEATGSAYSNELLH